MKRDKPEFHVQPTRVPLGGQVTVLPRCLDHLLCDEEGMCPEKLSGLEMKGQAVEMERKGCIGWYRDPSCTSQDSVEIVYDYAGDTLVLRPDFLFFSADESGAVNVDIVDPNGDFLAGSASKLRGLADYAEKHEANFERVEAVAKVDGAVLILVMKDENVRDMVRTEATSRDAYQGALSKAHG
ncbi:hypothetical protein K3175_07410 [Qipengyuania sp. GH1]|uniref:hypothetical protein n=1 Tax=Qipengyuania aestuarii TaxID=2867241 RepID=UPI001C881352|nr:hypothetical protein [Qipengyuania aestuarii]MBX7535486.1 hypothetical protein [Qipengyuania aestuarii]